MNHYTTPTLDRLAEQFGRLADRHGYTLLDGAGFDDFFRQEGETLVLFADDPQRVPETWDLVVILPELVKSLRCKLRVGLLAPELARALAPRYGIRLWPALLGLRRGAYLGVIEGMKDWSVYAAQLPQLLAAPASRAPGIGIPVQAVGAGARCH